MQQAQNEKDQLRGRLDVVMQERSSVENARHESVSRVQELERALLSRGEQLREDAERYSQRLQQIKSLLTPYCSDSFETGSDTDVTQAVRCLIQTVQDKTAVRYYYSLL